MIVQGNDSVIQSCVGAGEIHINLWEDMMGFLLMDNIRQLTKALKLFREHCLKNARLNEENCRKYANSSMAQVVDLKEDVSYTDLSDAISEQGTAEIIEQYKSSEETKGES